MPAELVINEALSFDDVILLPQYSDIKSRKDVDLTMKLWSQDGKTQYSFSLPVISSPMDTVTGPEMAYFMWKNGGLGILHRYCSIEEQVEMVNQTYKKFNEEVVFPNRDLIVGAAIGANGDYLERANALISAGVQIICIDVAHGDSKHMRTALAYLQKIVPGHIHIMAGNVATPDGFERLATWGANSVRVGIGGGAACFVPGTLVSTKNGQKCIEEIKPGEQVFTHSGELKTVNETFSFFKEENIMKINDILCTKDHLFYVVDRSDLKFVNSENVHEYAYWIESKFLNKNEHLLIELTD